MSAADSLTDYRAHVRMIVQDIAPETYRARRLYDHTEQDFHGGFTVKECADRWLSRRVIPPTLGDAA